MSCFYFWVSSDDIYAHFMVGVPVTVSARGLDSPSRHPPPHRDIIYRLQHFIISWSHVHSRDATRSKAQQNVSGLSTTIYTGVR